MNTESGDLSRTGRVCQCATILGLSLQVLGVLRFLRQEPPDGSAPQTKDGATEKDVDTHSAYA